jgi:hypothetical protein
VSSSTTVSFCHVIWNWCCHEIYQFMACISRLYPFLVCLNSDRTPLCRKGREEERGVLLKRSISEILWMSEWERRIGGMTLTAEKERELHGGGGGGICPVATLLTKDPTETDLDMNPGIRCERLAACLAGRNSAVGRSLHSGYTSCACYNSDVTYEEFILMKCSLKWLRIERTTEWMR